MSDNKDLLKFIVIAVAAYFLISLTYSLIMLAALAASVAITSFFLTAMLFPKSLSQEQFLITVISSVAFAYLLPSLAYTVAWFNLAQIVSTILTIWTQLLIQKPESKAHDFFSRPYAQTLIFGLTALVILTMPVSVASSISYLVGYALYLLASMLLLSNLNAAHHNNTDHLYQKIENTLSIQEQKWVKTAIYNPLIESIFHLFGYRKPEETDSRLDNKQDVAHSIVIGSALLALQTIVIPYFLPLRLGTILLVSAYMGTVSSYTQNLQETNFNIGSALTLKVEPIKAFKVNVINPAKKMCGYKVVEEDYCPPSPPPERNSTPTTSDFALD